MLEENVIFSKIMKAYIHNTLAFVNDLKKNHNKWGLQSSSSSSSIFFLTVFFWGENCNLQTPTTRNFLQLTWRFDFIHCGCNPIIHIQWIQAFWKFLLKCYHHALLCYIPPTYRHLEGLFFFTTEWWLYDCPFDFIISNVHIVSYGRSKTHQQLFVWARLGML